jgi:hypothetical protein
VGAVLGFGIVAAVGSGFLAYGLTREPYSKICVGIGAVILVPAAIGFMTNIANAGRRLELRKHGLRYVAQGSTTEFHWDDIVDVEVIRKENTNYGVVGVYKESSDEVSPSGLLTNTDFDVRIHARDGETIRLRPVFLKLVPDPKKLIQQIRMGADMRQ